MEVDTFSPIWVYSFADYCQMFVLTEYDLSQSILDYPGSISSFNAQAYNANLQVISADQIYNKDTKTMQQFVATMIATYQKQLVEDKDRYLMPTVELNSLFQNWQQTADYFLRDYQQGCQQQRYIDVAKPRWPFGAHQFDIALCSDIDFSQHQELNISPLEVIQELVRISKEVRIFPLLNLAGDIAPEWGEVMHWLQENQFGQEIKAISYKQLKGHNAMLRIWATECQLNNE